MLVETHSHTVYSKQKNIKWEGINTPEEMVLRAKEIGLGAICITDHDSVEAHKEAISAGKKHGVLVIPGIEVSSADGHILGYGVTETIPKGLSAEETIDLIHAQDGFAVAAHPFDIKGLGIQDKISLTDGIEVFNSLNLDKVANWINSKKASELDKPLLAGSDAHSVDMLGHSRNEMPDDIESVDDFLNALMTNQIKIAQKNYQPTNVMIDWTRERMSRSYIDIVTYINAHYSVPKLQISKFMLDRFVYSRSRLLNHAWTGLAKFAFNAATVYGGMKLLI